MSSVKDEGQVFTPTEVVTMILDSVKYNGRAVLTKTIMEPSFGKGAFLIEIVSRIIHEALKEEIEPDDICEIIDSHVYGIEKDQELYDETIQKLNSFLTVYEIPLPSWSHLVCGDTLKEYKEYEGKMDVCVGNPPYVRIHNIKSDYRELVKDFEYSDGTTDLYVVFYVLGIKMLNEDVGRLSYITPNSFLRNTSQKKFRNYLVENGLLSALFDFKDSKIFDKDTYTCICVIDKNKKRINSDFIEYREYNMYRMTIRNMIRYDYFRNQLKDTTWNLSSDDDILYLQQNDKRPIKIKSIATVQNGIATNRDVVYVGEAYLDKDGKIPYKGKHTDKKKNVWFNGWQIESNILHRCVKASKYNGDIDNSNLYILFPYQNKPKMKLRKISDNTELATKYEPFSEDDLKKRFPNAYAYLQEHWEDLESRDMDSNASWFEFGRSQGLVNSGYKKLVFKHVIDKSKASIEVHVVDEDVIVYSGIYITIDPSPFIAPNGSSSTFNDLLYDKELEEVRNILSSPDFHKYCTLVGKDMQGGYVSVSSTFVKNYGTQLTKFPNLPVEVPIEALPIADEDYMNKLFTDKFVCCIKESYENMAANGVTSPERVKPFHSYLAKVLKYKLGQDYDIVADGYSFGKEMGVEGNFDSKNVDVCVLKDDQILGAIAFKLLSNNFKQNYKNFSEGLLGETAQMKGIGIPYAFCYLIPEKALHREKVDKVTGEGLYKQLDVLTQNDLKIYYDIANDADYKNRTPDAMFIGVHKLFDESYLASLSEGDEIDVSSTSYLDGIQPEWSDLSFISDEELRQFFAEQLNLGRFLDTFIEKMKTYLR
ncbi:N-6 DNA Methylase [Ruminococcaceae bacterium YRB3002]|nr:N-6 DNA Methylase [Ruminococcaceae bacterium YRB3002]